MLIPSQHKIETYNVSPHLDDKLIRVASLYKYFGITIDNQSTFKTHIKNLEKDILWCWRVMELIAIYLKKQ